MNTPTPTPPTPPRAPTLAERTPLALVALSCGLLFVALVVGLLPGASLDSAHWLAPLALTPPLGACALAFIGARKASLVALVALALWLGGVVTLVATEVTASDWTFYTPYSMSAARFTGLELGALIIALASAVATAAGALATLRSARWSATCLGLASIASLEVVVELLLRRPLALDPSPLLEPLASAALTLPALGILGTALVRARWRGTPVAWAIAALSTLVAAVITQVTANAHAVVLDDTLYVVASHHYLHFTVVAGLLGGLAAARPGALGRAALALPLAYGLGAHLVAGVDLVRGEAGMPARYELYLDGAVERDTPGLPPLALVGALLVIAALAVVVLAAFRRSTTADPAATQPSRGSGA